MPLYYLNTKTNPYQFYCDNGELRSVLNIAAPDVFVRFTYFLGMDDFTKRPKVIYNNKVSPELNPLTEWMPADMLWRRVLDNHFFVQEFILEFNDGMIAECRNPQELLITFFDPDSVNSIFDACGVHHSARAPLMLEPGSLLSVNRRNGVHSFMGYFKSIKIWIKQTSLETSIKSGSFYPSNMN